MRKETILNYEKEFLAWCKGESILLGAPASMHEKPLVWREVRDFNDWKPLDTVYVLNDSYSTYRKALAEGKPIQMYCKYDDVPPFWDDMTEVIKSIGFVMTKDNYRIKPEESKFKIGDWVRTPHRGIFQIQHEIELAAWEMTLGCRAELWTPQLGEWCWFSNKNGIPTIGQFLSIETDGNRKYSATFPNTPHPFITYYDYCEPFLGQLPTNIQEAL